MSVRSSLSNRSDGHPWHGNKLGARHGGSAQRNWNSSHKGPNASDSNVPRPASNSRGSRDTSPEPQRGDHDQGAVNSQVSDGQQHRDRSNTEHNGPSDPRNGKRRLDQAVTEFVQVGLSRSSKRRKSDLPEKYVFFWVSFHLLLHLPL